MYCKSASLVPNNTVSSAINNTKILRLFITVFFSPTVYTSGSSSEVAVGGGESSLVSENILPSIVIIFTHGYC